MKLTVSKKQDAIKDTGDGGLINASGIYDVNLNYVQLAESKGGALQINFNVTNNGMEQTIWGPYLTSKAGDVNEITQNLLNRLCIIAGMEDGQEIETETVENPVGKDQKMMEMEVIPELSDVPVKIRIQMEYSLYNDEIQERKVVKAFYREDGATAAEAESGENIGRRLALDEEKYASNVTYKDGLTEEDVNAWKAERANARSAAKGSDSAPKASKGAAAKTKAKRPLFGQK
ncbi:hypothetical protein AD45P2_00545 [Alteromonas phage vB_AmaP_AD45-P2]|uniref:DUF669 domain-containing protein n=1 Tax=Pseudorhizobium pelagicum TaxID=1509405 RepID=A0A922NZ81_9HYPH|nr:hypothetical protein [Pseudorhizobium pelagicum]YP_008126078.1 single strand DNA binding protein [Alteromonas phage vB_AmaP_AD45-P1]AGM47158.1 hypothetical protein AD45P4_00515 [Alteromonas phage vB_AmaP_AD45-P4]AGM47280.1 hypothetical protein AD45P2_00545 [Alteromonas phage vB_AmaP_AD45-P2]AGM46925.1 hypothetical protein AD45P1_00535 [Alteromonas phage vB_AmaP_AD45-P1]KEQ05602.1 hypothetical protein GV68_08720 [Pseudorhizobium pelagicum]